jgi:uncharacterized membrane protein
MRFLYRVFLKGLLTLLPITLTVYLFAWIVTHIEAALRNSLLRWLPSSLDFPGSGLVIAIALVFIVGLLVNSYLTGWIVAWIEARLEETPVIRSIYSPLRDVTNLFVRDGSNGGQRVVMVLMGDPMAQSGLPALEAIGLVTRDSFHDLPPGSVPENSLTVFIPFSYGMGGYTLIVPKSRVREVQISADRALQLALTAWIKSSPKKQ